MKRRLSTLLMILVLITGIGLLAYPVVSDWYNTTRQARTIVSYAKSAAELDEQVAAEALSQAEVFNQRLAAKKSALTLTDAEAAEYRSLLDINGAGMMGYIEIPKVNIKLPIYHGTDESVLQTSVGHMEGSSLPVGTKSSHCVLSGHRGLPSAKLFTNIDKLEQGDTFSVTVLNISFLYEVDQILTVEPENTAPLRIEPDQDYCTLLTCTPYGVNTHRLLVRGHRIGTETVSPENQDETRWKQTGIFTITPFTLIPVVILVCIAVILLVLWKRQRRKKNNTKHQIN
ncbi:MAG: class C sortase [Clostridiales bacterium]|nr:class C sortase [Clostridiales bacterium]